MPKAQISTTETVSSTSMHAQRRLGGLTSASRPNTVALRSPCHSRSHQAAIIRMNRSPSEVRIHIASNAKPNSKHPNSTLTVYKAAIHTYHQFPSIGKAGKGFLAILKLGLSLFVLPSFSEGGEGNRGEPPAVDADSTASS